MAGDDLIAAILSWSDDCGNEYAINLDALCGFLHRIIVPRLKGIVWKWVQLCEWNLLNRFLLLFGLLWMYSF